MRRLYESYLNGSLRGYAHVLLDGLVGVSRDRDGVEARRGSRHTIGTIGRRSLFGSAVEAELERVRRRLVVFNPRR
jgi:hypothetical protein